jgi:excisionase family DNA binding protein
VHGFNVGEMTNRTTVLRPRRENEVDQESSNEAPRPLLVSATDAARVLAIGRTTLYEIVESGDLTPIHIRRCVRFSMYEISQYVESLARRHTRAA